MWADAGHGINRRQHQVVAHANQRIGRGAVVEVMFARAGVDEVILVLRVQPVLPVLPVLPVQLVRRVLKVLPAPQALVGLRVRKAIRERRQASGVVSSPAAAHSAHYQLGALMAFTACRQSAAASVGREACRGRGRRSST